MELTAFFYNEHCYQYDFNTYTTKSSVPNVYNDVQITMIAGNSVGEDLFGILLLVPIDLLVEEVITLDNLIFTEKEEYTSAYDNFELIVHVGFKPDNEIYMESL